jgi:hypothetical protein
MKTKNEAAVKEPHPPSDLVQGNLEDHLWASRKAFQSQKTTKGLNFPNKELLSRKRPSRDEIKHNKALALPNLNQLCCRESVNSTARPSARSRKSISPKSQRNKYHGASHSTLHHQAVNA